jgi:hypothetical protein
MTFNARDFATESEGSGLCRSRIGKTTSSLIPPLSRASRPPLGLKEALELAVKHGAVLNGAKLYAARLRGADLRNAKLEGADLRVADLVGANLESAKLTSADLQMSLLHNANLQSADLRNANLRYAVLAGANLVGAKFDHCDLTHTECEPEVQGQGLQTTYIHVRKRRA